MRRLLACLLIVVMLPWHAASVAATVFIQDTEQVRHAMAHWTGEGHHHHDHAHDAAFHADDSDESRQHVVYTDAHMSAAFILAATPTIAVEVPPAAVPPERVSPPPPDPFLQGLRRPPRSLG